MSHLSVRAMVDPSCDGLGWGKQGMQLPQISVMKIATGLQEASNISSVGKELKG